MKFTKKGGAGGGGNYACLLMDVCDLVSSNSVLVMVIAHYYNWRTCIIHVGSCDYYSAPLKVRFLLVPMLNVRMETDYHG